MPANVQTMQTYDIFADVNDVTSDEILPPYTEFDVAPLDMAPPKYSKKSANAFEKLVDKLADKLATLFTRDIYISTEMVAAANIVNRFDYRWAM